MPSCPTKIVSLKNQGHIRALKKDIQWNELLGMIYIQQSLSECVEQNEDSKLYPFMQVATIDGMDNLEKVYQLALLDTRLIYESAEIHSRKKQKKC